MVLLTILIHLRKLSLSSVISYTYIQSYILRHIPLNSLKTVVL